MEKIWIASPQIGMDETREVIDVLKSGMLAQGKKVAEFEKKFAEFIGVKYAVACSSGTAALHMSLLSLGIGEGDEVITTPFTFIATINMIKAVGAKPVFVDIKDDFNIDENLIEKAITSKTKAILPVHLFGLPCNMEKIMEIGKKHHIEVIEDAAQACGATYKKKKVGAIGKIGTFSFYPTKVITTGEGGMCTTNNKRIFEKLKLIRNHGMVGSEYDYSATGFNYRMSDIEGAIGISQLSKIESFIKVRKNIGYNYNFHLEPYIKVHKEEDGIGHVYNNYSFVVPEKHRELFMLNLQENGIDCKIYYPKPFVNLPNATRISKQIVSIPIRSNMTTDEMQHIIYHVGEITKWLKQK